MSQCEFSNQLSAYMDGELSESQARAIQQHLAACPACAAELRGFAEISRLVGRWEVPELSPLSLQRMHQQVQRVSFRRLERLAFTLSSMAAAMVVATMLWSSQAAQPPTTIALWEQAAIAPAEYASGNNSQEASMAQWVVADLSAGGSQRD